jgi:multidrug resistance efflux pump
MLDTQVVLPPNPRQKVIVTRSVLANCTVTMLSLGLGYWAFRMLQERLTTVVSRDAVINGTLVSLNAPIDGTVSQLTVTTGTLINPNQTLAALNHPVLAAPTSQTPRQELKTRIADLQARLGQARIQLNQTLSLQATWAEEKTQQQQLENHDAQDTIAQVESELRTLESRYRYADVFYQRQLKLQQEGAIAKATLDAVSEDRETLGNQIKTLEAQLKNARTHAKATELGINLTRERNNYNPRLRLQDLKTQATTQQQEIAILEQSLQSAQAELTQVTADLKNQQSALQRLQQQTVVAPMTGVIWELLAREGQFVQKGAALGQVLDCRRRWVDVSVDEDALRSIRPGTAAKIELFGAANQILNGKVTLIRSGVGRLQAGQEVAAVAVPANLPRTTQVRVDLDAGTDQGTPEAMCYVGYTAKVSFAVTK